MSETSDKKLRYLGPVLKKIRTERGLTQSEAADELSVSHTAITYIETGRRMPRMDKMLCEMSRMYRVPLSEIFRRVEEMEHSEQESSQSDN